jgi:hypothetical protein
MIAAKPCTAENYRHIAAVYRNEANARRADDPHFAGILDGWADKKDRQALAADTPEQPDLFGEAA